MTPELSLVLDRLESVKAWCTVLDRRLHALEEWAATVVGGYPTDLGAAGVPPVPTDPQTHPDLRS